MGCTVSSNPQSAANAEIEKRLRNDKFRIQHELKLLLLGAGESGKSTVAKQMKILFLNGFTESELALYKPLLRSNIVEAIMILCRAATELEVDCGELTDLVEKYRSIAFTTVVTPEMLADFKTLWESDVIQDVFKRRSQFQLNDGAGFLLPEMDRICTEPYVPSTQDILRCRVRTTAIVETEFEVEDFHFRLVDVGGQRSERRKWLHCFESVTAIIFVAALHEYDLTLFEDKNVNRFHESLKLFEETTNCDWFKDTAVLLFLNKKDLFEEKIKWRDPSYLFPEYTGGSNYDKALAFLQEKYMEQTKRRDKPIYAHVTCATDTGNVSTVFGACRHILLEQQMKETFY